MTQMQTEKVQMDQEKLRKLLQAATDVKCKCGCQIFNEGMSIKKISSLDPNNPTGKDSFTSIPIIYCVKCFEPLNE